MPAATQGKSLLIKPASGDCNLNCTYCFYHARPDDPYRTQARHRMSPEVLDALIRQGMALDRRQATFGWQGGEPTLCGLAFFEQVVALQQRYGVAGQSVSNGLQTNALLLDSDWAPFLRRYNFLLGISLDGPAEYHDHYRQYANGGPTHARVMESIHLLEQQRVEFNILTVVNNITGDHGGEVFDWLVDQGFSFLQFIPCVEVDPATGQLTSFSVSPEQFGDFMCTVFDRWFNGGQPEVSVRDFEALLAVYLGQEATMCCYQDRCGSYVVVEYNGDLYPCDFLVRDDLHLGNLLEAPLDEVFAGQALARFAACKADPRPECQVCRWLPVCQQGCYRLVGVTGDKRHYLCRAYQRFFAHAHEPLMALAARIARSNGIDPRRLQPPVAPIGRNDLCPCGSGKKYKHCCGRLGAVRT
ncbi:MAG: anaerobic sulfatase maturase [Anaerolineae bacterium]